MQMIKAAIFDMDGVVADSTKNDFLAWKKIFSEFDKKLDMRMYRKFTGEKSTEIIKEYVKGNLPKRELLRIQDKKEKLFIKFMHKNGMKTPKGLKLLIKKLRAENIRIALATAANNEKTNKVLQYLGLSKEFRIKVTGDEAKKGKPSPEIFLKAAKKLGCMPRECVVFEDSPLGIIAAKKGKMNTIGITTTHTRKQLKKAGADLVTCSFKKLDIETIKKV